MRVNKVIVNGETAIDLTGDTVSAETLLAGRTAHSASGESITGTLEGGASVVSPEVWGEMTAEEKTASGLTAVAAPGAFSGRWFDYSAGEFAEMAGYLPASDPEKIITFATFGNFDPGRLSWGGGSSPVILQGFKTADAGSGSVLIDTLDSGECAYVDVGSENKELTVYAVLKISAPAGQYARHLSMIKSKSASQGFLLYGNSAVNCSVWAGDTATGVSPADFYALAVSFDGGSVHFRVNGVTVTKSLNNLGRFLTVGRSLYNDANTASNSEPSNVHLKFLSVVSEAESGETTAANLQSLMSRFGI